MAKKEERIWLEFDIPKPKGAIEATICTTMTRQEAIEHMAKAICKFEMMSSRRVCKECSKECFEHLELEVVNKAEAALNALLEGDK